MKKSKLTLAGFILASSMVLPVRAQVSMGVSKITCEQFVLYKVTDPDKIVIWLSGYHHAKRGSTIIDTKDLEQSSNKLREYCRSNFNVTVMQAVDTLISASK